MQDGAGRGGGAADGCAVGLEPQIAGYLQASQHQLRPAHQEHALDAVLVGQCGGVFKALLAVPVASVNVQGAGGHVLRFEKVTYTLGVVAKNDNLRGVALLVEIEGMVQAGLQVGRGAQRNEAIYAACVVLHPLNEREQGDQGQGHEYEGTAYGQRVPCVMSY